MPSNDIAEAARLWSDSTAHYTPMALSIDGHAVMERWETPYMAALAAIAAAPGGPVLEIGYGLGISCEQIGNHEPERHVVIECHPEVAARMLSEQRQAVSAGRLELAVGTWQRHTHRWMNGTFSGILFDPYPLTDHEMRGPHYDFFAEARRLLRPGGVLTYYSDEPSELAGRHWDALIAAGFLPLDIGWETVQVDVPPDCEYWSSPTIVAPIVYRR